MKDRRQSKKTFIRYAGKAFIFLDFLVVILQLVLMYQQKTADLSPTYAFLTFITGFIFGAAGWSDHRKETQELKPSSAENIEREP